ncbi:hypothetical protein CR513_39775, partial [Mucuna pruriens]
MDECVFQLLTLLAITICAKAGNCPDAKACYNYCVFWGYKDYGGRCTVDRDHLCCCISAEVIGPIGHR